MSRYTGADVIAAATAAGADATLARIMAAAALSEGGGDTNAAGDFDTNGIAHSFGPYQINDINQVPREVSTDLTQATEWMLDNEFDRAYEAGRSAGYTGEQLARWTCMAAERPWGWNGPNDPGLDSPAADSYAAQWSALGEAPMPTTRTYDPTVEAVRQSDPWSCSVAATAFMLHSLGIEDSYPALEVAMVRDGIVSATLGLLDGSGGALAQWIANQYGVTADHFWVTWDWLLDHAGTGPIAIGSGSLYHWVAVRGVDGEGNLTLSNPAPGYRGLGDTMTEAQFAQWAPWACVWIAVEEAEDMGQVEDLTNKLGYLQGDVADALQRGVDGARIAKTKAQRDAAYQSIEAAIATLRRGGASE